MRHVFVTLAVLLGAFPLIAFAQSTSPIGSAPDPVQYIVTPETPGPGDTVSIEVQGVGTFLGDATLTWTKDGKQDLVGIGARNYQFKVGGLGSHTTIDLTINSATQGIIKHSFSFYPSVVNMLWEADTSIPPLYRGKALYSGGAMVLVAVFPEVSIRGVFISSKALSYQWSLNDNNIPEQSGLGRSVFVFKGDQLKQGEQVAVDISLNNNKVAHGQVYIPASSPQVVLYQRDPLRGELLTAALPQQLTLLGKEITVQAEPYYFSNSSKNSSALTYAWTLNDNDATGPDANKGILTLRQAGSGGGNAVVAVSAQNTEGSELIQAANTAMQLIFGGSQSTSAFGI